MDVGKADDDFDSLLEGYLDTTNPDMAGVDLDLAPGCGSFGIDHASAKHGVSEGEIREVLLELPAPERKRSDHQRQPPRFLYWGSTRAGRDIAVVVYERIEEGRTVMTLITAFPESEECWRRRK